MLLLKIFLAIFALLLGYFFCKVFQSFSCKIHGERLKRLDKFRFWLVHWFLPAGTYICTIVMILRFFSSQIQTILELVCTFPQTIGMYVMNTGWLGFVVFVSSMLWPLSIILGTRLFENDPNHNQIFAFFLFSNVIVMCFCLLLIQPYIRELNGPILSESNRTMVWFFMTCVASVTPICWLLDIFKGLEHLAEKISKRVCTCTA